MSVLRNKLAIPSLLLKCDRSNQIWQTGEPVCPISASSVLVCIFFQQFYLLSELATEEKDIEKSNSLSLLFIIEWISQRT